MLAEALPMLSTGKVDYIALTELALAEGKNGGDWINRLASLVGKSSTGEKDAMDAENCKDPSAN